MITFNKLKVMCVRNNINPTTLYKKLNITGRTIVAIAHNKSVSLETIDRICNYFKCQPSDIMEFLPEEEK